MNADNQAGSMLLESLHQCKVPQGPAAIQSRADDSGRHRLQVTVRSPLEHDSVNVVSYIEVGIELPGWQPHVEGGEDRALLVAGNEIELRLDVLSAGVQRDGALELARARDIERLPFAFQIQKERVPPR